MGCLPLFKRKEKDIEKQRLTGGKDTSSKYGASDIEVEDLSMLKEKLMECEHLVKERDDVIKTLTQRLSKEMSAKVGADESSVENVSIKTRPMNVAEEYQLACSQEWLSAKTSLDGYSEDGIRAECAAVVLLCDIMKIAEKRAEELFMAKEEAKKEFLNQYGDLKLVDAKTIANLKVPADLNNALIDFLRNTSDGASLEAVEEGTKTDLQNNFQKKSSQELLDLWYKSKEEASLIEYISKIVRITWKMAIQRPPMEFRFSKEWLGDKHQELYWNSEPNAADVKVVHVYPMLYHNNALMAKGKVLVVSKAKLDQN